MSRAVPRRFGRAVPLLAAADHSGRHVLQQRVFTVVGAVYGHASYSAYAPSAASPEEQVRAAWAEFLMVVGGGTVQGGGFAAFRAVFMAVPESTGWIEVMLGNIRSSGHVPDDVEAACVDVARTMLKGGYRPAFVAGLLGNICSEGNTGKFESSNYDNAPTPEPYYLINMDKFYNYRKGYSGQRIYNKNLTTVYNLVFKLNADGWYLPGKAHTAENSIGFGLGTVQWSWGRCYTLMGFTGASTAAGTPSLSLRRFWPRGRWWLANWKTITARFARLGIAGQTRRGTALAHRPLPKWRPMSSAPTMRDPTRIT
ncbi:MAG: phage tail tip lysozyme [Actinomycetia bacterium]|nr:phage tail tip lysozyme [Actinomycetes bacterium]